MKAYVFKVDLDYVKLKQGALNYMKVVDVKCLVTEIGLGKKKNPIFQYWSC